MSQNRHYKSPLLVLILIVLSFGAVYWFLKGSVNVVEINGAKVSYKAAITAEEKGIGLSETTNLPENEGMLFFFNGESPSFWMKDMSIPIDIIWIASGNVVKIDENVPPPTSSSEKLQTYIPPHPIDFVLEVNAGFAERNNIKVGDEVKIN